MKDAHHIECASAEGLLTLLSLPGVGRVSAERLCRQFTTLADIFDSLAVACAGLRADAAQALSQTGAWERAHESAEREIERAQALGIRLLSFLAPDYPRSLSLIPDPPPLLYVKGSLGMVKGGVACVGTRHPTPFGVKATQGLTSALAAAGWTVVSGLALGVDSTAHRACLTAGGHTVAVLGNGLDHVYPPKHLDLAEEILASGGALVSEQRLGVSASAQTLVPRDRLQSGLSLATVVMQTGVEGGTLHTVRYTLLQGRGLFVAVPPESLCSEAESQGNLALTSWSGQSLGRLLKAKGPFASRLATWPKPVAEPILGRDDYPRLLATLEELRGQAQQSLLSPETN